jgi:signal transduction histidine kinase/phage shock protein PspC (stress-responsive transcriptional regulator)
MGLGRANCHNDHMAEQSVRWEPVRVARVAHGRVSAGVCAGWAARYGVDPYVLRLALLVLSLPAGLGLVIYGVAWLLSLPPTAPVTAAEQPQPSPRLRACRSAGVACLAAASLLACRSIGVWPGDAVMLPAVGMAFGAGLLWFQGRDTSRSANPLNVALAPSADRWRAIGGGFLALAGVIGLIARGVDLRSLPSALAAIATVAAGAALLGGPYIAHLTDQLRSEERERIRVAERADMAAQLHDSVLQTLALMQRSSNDPRRMVTLARRQERQLRNWLYGHDSAPTGSLSAQIDGIVATVEDDHHVRVDAVVVGDAPPSAVADGVAGAIREAVVNAAKHSGCDAVAVFVEVAHSEITAYVRDTGVGFDAARPADPAHGIATSIRQRLARVGGQAALTTAVGEGTEWEISAPVTASGAGRS